MYISQNNEWLILLFCSSPWCIHWLSRRFSPQLWRFVIKMSNLACFFLSFGAGSFWHLKRKKSCWEKNVVVYFIFLKESDVVINMLNCLLMCVFWWILRNIWYDNLKNIFFFQYMVNRIHNNYALQVRAITLAFFMPYQIHQWMNGVIKFHFLHMHDDNSIDVLFLHLWQIVANSFLANPTTSATFATILVDYLLARLEEMGCKDMCTKD